MEGQSINRSSMKFNIPARTLRDWMKRLNIKSVFTHNVTLNSDDPNASSDHVQPPRGEIKTTEWTYMFLNFNFSVKLVII